MGSLVFDASAKDFVDMRAMATERKLATIGVGDWPLACKARKFYLPNSKE